LTEDAEETVKEKFQASHEHNCESPQATKSRKHLKYKLQKLEITIAKSRVPAGGSAEAINDATTSQGDLVRKFESDNEEAVKKFFPPKAESKLVRGSE
jgi:hypothetical protein